MNSRDITVYLDDRWCKALETHTDPTMESLLTGLYPKRKPVSEVKSAGRIYVSDVKPIIAISFVGIYRNSHKDFVGIGE